MDSSLIMELMAEKLQSLPDCHNLQDFISEFYHFWHDLGRLLQEELVQSKIEQIEAKYSGAKKKKKKRYYTPLGEMVIERRAYPTSNGMKFKADEELELRKDKWLPIVLELACALGVSSEFPNAHKLFQKFTNIELTEKTVANQVEKTGNKLQFGSFKKETKLEEKTEDREKRAKETTPDVIYVGVDGVMTPLNQKQGYKEAKVGVIFGKKDHQKPNKRGVVRQREYLATLRSRDEFRGKIEELYQQVIGEKTIKTVVMGDGAHWIWDMAKKQFPGAIEILDFYHLSEYVWDVGKAAFPRSEKKQKEWVNKQQQLLKKSQWKNVINCCYQLKRKNQKLRNAITDKQRYLINNQNRIDYHSYLKLGLMIGSGVVESSNRRIVTQRLKQAGMHWSSSGAEGVMGLRAAYLSNSNRWLNFWQQKRNNQVS